MGSSQRSTSDARLASSGDPGTGSRRGNLTVSNQARICAQRLANARPLARRGVSCAMVRPRKGRRAIAKAACIALAVLMLGDLSGGRAQAPNSQATTLPELVPYGALSQVPPNACVWANLIYSPGAIIATQVPMTSYFPSYFRCVQGTWEVTSPGEAMADMRPRGPGPRGRGDTGKH